MKFEPQIDILPDAQRELWQELDQVPKEFTLYGGTAIALHVGHRKSVDFDFFAQKEINPEQLRRDIPFLMNADIRRSSENTLTCLVDKTDPVSISFFGLPNVKEIQEPVLAQDNGIKIASLVDLAGTKVSVVQQRSEAKDYIDIAAMLNNSVLELPEMLLAGRQVYGEKFNSLTTLKALTYFNDGDLNTLSHEVKETLTDAVRSVDLRQLASMEQSVDASLKLNQGMALS